MIPDNRDLVMVLKEARTLVERGWAQGAMWRNAATGASISGFGEAVAHARSGTLQVCVLGACEIAGGLRGNHVLSRRAIVALQDATGLGPLVPPVGDFGALNAYNDRPSRTQAEVLALFDRAIEIAGSWSEAEARDGRV